MTSLAHVSGGVSDPAAAVEQERGTRTEAQTGVPSADAMGSPPSAQSLHALDWLNFLLAGLLMGFGPFVGLHLASERWMPASVGFVFTVGGLAGLLTQIPAGELIDIVRSKRALVGAGAAAVASGVLLLALRPDFAPVLTAMVMKGIAASIIAPGIAAISLGLVGHDALGSRLGRNQQFASIGGLAAAGMMGGVGYLLSTRDVFLLTAALGLPAIMALVRIRASDIHFARSCGAAGMHPTHPRRVNRTTLLGDRRLLIFAACLFLFQLANASILPLMGETLAHTGARSSSLVLSAFVVVPQIVVAFLAPWVGRKADTWGRRPLLLAGLAALPVRAAGFALISDPAPLIIVQALDGLSGATLGVLTALVIADLTKGTGRFNLAQGLVATVSGVGAALSTFVTGLIVASFGEAVGFSSAAATGLLAVIILWRLMPETKSPSPKGSA